MINIDKLKNVSVLELLNKYKGKNPYLKKLRKEYMKGKVAFTNTQVKYISEFHNVDPHKVERVIAITEYLGLELQKKYSIKFVPEKILIGFILADTDKAFHIYGKLKKNQENYQMYWLPKTQVLDDPYWEEPNVEVDFDKYVELDNKNRTPYEHQKSGIKFLLSRKGAILADDMGLGKSYMSIVAALESGAERILVVCPSAVKINWEREINCFDDQTVIINGKKWDTSKFTIINYDILKNFHTTKDKRTSKEYIKKGGLINNHLVDAKFDLVIIDEAHNLKNYKSIRGKIMSELIVKYGIERTWLLTGTPVANKPMDFYNLLKLVGSPLVENFNFFAKRYCDGKTFWKKFKNGKSRKIWLTDGASNLNELAAKTKNIIIRRKKEDVLDMPEKTISTIYHELTPKQIKEYTNIWEEYLIERKKKKKRGAVEKDLVELILLRKYIALETIPKTIEMIENAIEQGNKVIVFTNFQDEMDVLYDHFKKIAVKHNGKMSGINKQISVDRFQEDDNVKLFIGNVISAGVGITLTAATTVIFNSLYWVPGNILQAIDRCIFKGQLVMTNNGYVSIEDIKIGDMVYSHEGNFKKVVNTHSHLERKKLRVDIDAFGFNNTLATTHDHKIYVYNKEFDSFNWVEAGKLDIKNELLTLKSNKQPSQRKEFITLTKHSSNTFINNWGVEQRKSGVILPEQVELSNDLLYAFGFYVADGWSTDGLLKNGAGINVVQKIDNKKMYDAAEYIMNIFRYSFGFEKHSEYIDKKNAKTCMIYNTELALNFLGWFGKGAYNKQFPDWVDELNNEQLKSLLDGYYHGDGHQRKNTQQATTASSKLMSQLMRYNANLGRGVSLQITNTGYYSIEYTIDPNKKNRIYEYSGYILYPIKSLHISRPVKGEDRVYDLSVEDDHSFIVGNYNVHNCYRIGQENNVSVYFNIFKNTIDERIWERLFSKTGIIETILNGEQESNIFVADDSNNEDELDKIIDDE